MSAQRPGRALQFQGLDDNDTERQHGRRSYIFYDSPAQKGFDYLTQMSDGEHELMFGGGMEAFPETDIRDGSMYDVHSAAHVSGALPVYFGSHNWGAEALSVAEDVHERTEVTWAAGRVKALWSGVLSVSVDERPWVGRIPSEISGRAVPRVGAVGSEKGKAGRTASPGEWVAAGYSGEGMVHAWLCARALALMVLGRENDVELKFEGMYGARQTVDQWFRRVIGSRYNVGSMRAGWRGNSGVGRRRLRCVVERER
ncbi:hypothetical protein JVU11DRAFT_9499 [Chiua virens]|nr:hypothetical protein JVU11DRAFT_9499 [Chiua virens]